MAAARSAGKRTDGHGVDAIAVLVLTVGAFLLRATPIRGISLWWDELVHIHMATSGSFLEVLEGVKLGIPPGFGNAGAVPLDYLLLNGWLRLVPAPSPEWLEAYYRAPALAWSVLTVVLTYLYALRFFDRGLALVAATLLATSVSHSIYAAEVRNYSLFGLMTVVNLYAFSALVHRRRSAKAWITYTAIAVLYFTSGFMSLLVTLGQYIVLAALLLLDAAKAPCPGRTADVARLAFPLASGLVVLAVVAAYLSDTFLGVQYGRPTESLDTWERTYAAIDFFAWGSPLLLVAFAAGMVLLLVCEWRRGRESFAIAIGLAMSFATIPIIVEIERWKEYYFHPRHAFFLLPVFALVIAGGLLTALRGLDPLRRTALSGPTRKNAYTAVAISFVLLTQFGPVSAHLENPNAGFRRSKTVRQFRSLVDHLRERVDAMAPGEVYLLITERRRPGHIGNPVLAKYLEWHGLADRVVLRGTDRPHETREAMIRICPDGCVGQPAARVQQRLGAIGPFNSRRQMLELVEVEASPQTSAPVGGIGLSHYWRLRSGPPARADGFVVTKHVGLSLFEIPSTVR